MSHIILIGDEPVIGTLGCDLVERSFFAFERNQILKATTATTGIQILNTRSAATQMAEQRCMCLMAGSWARRRTE